MRILISSRILHFMQFFDCRQKTRPSTLGVVYPNIDVENTIMFDFVRKELAKGARMHGSVSQLLWSQVEADFILKLRWVSSKDNVATDALTRPESTEHVQLYHLVIDRLRFEWHGFNMDPLCRGRSGRALHIFIRDITLPEAPEFMYLHRMLSVLPSPWSHVYFIFPPSQIVGVVTAHVCKYRSCSVLIIPAARLSWFPLLAPAFVGTFSA